uniref:RRM domain-containing protein n=1 Tax=Leersia perrieri TaxID=77586 RepID=A0A0D9VSK2_9ORYZ
MWAAGRFGLSGGGSQVFQHGGLSFYTTEEELRNVFSPCGTIEEVRLVSDNQTGRPKGFGFVKYSSQTEAEKAVKSMDGREGTLDMMMRGGQLAGLVSRVVGAKSFSTEIFVSKLSFYTTEEELKNVFAPFGAVEEARLVRDNQTSRPKGFGFVKYSSREEAEKAVKAMDGRVFPLLI